MGLQAYAKLAGWLKVPLTAAAAGALGFGVGQTGIGAPHSHAGQPEAPPITATPEPPEFKPYTFNQPKTPTPPPPFAPVPADLKPYTYSGDDCADGDAVDPITAVFVKDGFPDWIRAHMSHIGWSHAGGGSQHFGAAPNGQEECESTDGEAWRNDGLCFTGPPCTRFHVRFYMHQFEGSPRVHPTYGGFASASPHYEKRIEAFGDCGVLPDHAVADNSQEFQINKITVRGGFNYAREKIKETWVRTPHSDPIPFPDPRQPVTTTSHYHPLVDVRNWDNVDVMGQCDGGDAFSSGKVFYIGVKAA